MLPAKVGESFSSRPSSSSLHIVEAASNPFDGLREVLAFPFEVGSQGIIERRGWILSTA